MSSQTRSCTIVTGAAGFIGYNVAKRLIAAGENVVLIDNLDPYYSVALKSRRLQELGVPCSDGQSNDLREVAPNILFTRCDLRNANVLDLCPGPWQATQILHFAAQAGVRYSLENPHAYIDANVHGFQSVLDYAVKNKIKRVIYASSSSVYGTDGIPFSESSRCETPLSIYAASKRMNELMAHVYAENYAMELIGLRFFTVYGPWGRPDMAYYKFASDIMCSRTIKLHENGAMRRDFTYVDDVVRVILALRDYMFASGRSASRIFNVGNSKPERVRTLIELLESNLKMKAIVQSIPMQPGEVRDTYSDNTLLRNTIGFEPHTTLEDGIRSFCEWYLSKGLYLDSSFNRTTRLTGRDRNG